MNCNEVRNILAASDEGTAGAVSEPAASHLLSCRECAQFQSELTKTWQMMDSWREREPSADFRAKVWQRIDQREQQSAWAGWYPVLASSQLLRRSMAALTLILLVSGGTLLMVQRPVVEPPVATVAVNNDSDDDEKLLTSLTQLTQSAATRSLEVYDLWKMNADETTSPDPPSREKTDNEKPSKSPGGASDENIN